MIVLSFLVVAQVGLADDTPDPNKAGNYGLNTTAEKAFGPEVTKNSIDLPTSIGKIVGIALSFLGVVFFILIIYAGYLWMFSMGNEQTVTKAKEIIIAAVIGLVIVLAAYAITSYLGGALYPSK